MSWEAGYLPGIGRSHFHGSSFEADQLIPAGLFFPIHPNDRIDCNTGIGLFTPSFVQSESVQLPRRDHSPF
jgi:hypothetical protein